MGHRPYQNDATQILIMIQEHLPGLLRQELTRIARSSAAAAALGGISQGGPGIPETEVETGFPSFVSFSISNGGSAAQDMELYTNMASGWFLLDLVRGAQHVFYTGTVLQQNWAIAQADTGLLTIAGVDLTAKFPNGQTFWVSGSTGNDGLLTSLGAALNGSDTEISVSGPADLTDDGRVFLLDISMESTECGPFGSNPGLDRTSLTVSLGIDSSGNLEMRCAADSSGDTTTAKLAWLAFKE